MELANNVTTTLVKYAAGLKYEDIPQDVIHMTKRVFMDIIGCGLGSHELDKGRIGYSLAHQLGGTPRLPSWAPAKSCPSPAPPSPTPS